MELTWLDPQHVDGRAVAGAVAVLEAAREVDSPHELGWTVSSFTANLRHGWDGQPPQVAVARDDSGRIVGVLEVDLPHWDNTHLGFVAVTVDPLNRRQGLGSRLFEAALELLRASSRTLVVTYCFDGSAGVGFAKALGLDRASDEVQRRQDLLTLDWAQLDREYDAAAASASAYELVQIAGRSPDDALADIAEMTAAINDAPTDDLEIEDEVFTPERIRAFETAQEAWGRRMYRVVARERTTGALAGHTMVGVDAERPHHASQLDTSVLRAHRGHRLGLCLKIAMLRWLNEAEPQARVLDTWNAASNAHMIRVNEVLDYRVVAHGISWQRHL